MCFVECPSVSLMYSLHKIICFRIRGFRWEFIGFIATCFKFGLYCVAWTAVSFGISHIYPMYLYLSE